MQQNIIRENPATKKDLDIVQKSIKDLEERLDNLNKKVSTQLATKADLKRESKAQWQGQLRLEEKIENLEESNNKRFDEIQEHQRKDKDGIMNKLDYLIGKYEAAEQDSIIGTHQIRELRERLDEHDKILKSIQQH